MSIIQYKFGNNPTKELRVDAENVTIDTSTEGGYGTDGYLLSYFNPNNHVTRGENVVSHFVEYTGLGGFSNEIIHFFRCSNRSLEVSENCISNTVITDYTKRCPVAGNCVLNIKSGGVIVQRLSGQCPVVAEIFNDDDCHSGCCKLPSPYYPGFCCVKVV